MRTSTPRLAAAASSSTKLRSGAKYALVMYSVLRAPAIERAKKRSAAVLPSVGDVYSSPADVTPSSCGASVARPVNSTPVASTHAAANAAWS